MYIGNSPQVLATRGITKGDWDKCLEKNLCRSLAIAGISVAILAGLWLILTLVRCIFMGKSCLQACFCCCHPVNKKNAQFREGFNYSKSYGPTHPPRYQSHHHSKPSKAHLYNNGYERVHQTSF
ncbi:hypothetical protein G9P44_004815 [Scheffersomyces stipitis]|nr:hypothetical protein G9P44_004815 [Scheffersomyces stipitis]